MDTLYSVTLLVSLLSGAIAIAHSLAIRWPRLAQRIGVSRRYVQRGMMTSIFVAYAALAVSLGVHANWGHQSGSADALHWVEFFRIHPAFLAAAVLPVMAVLLAGRESRR
jgi:hypothetical protein